MEVKVLLVVLLVSISETAVKAKLRIHDFRNSYAGNRMCDNGNMNSHVRIETAKDSVKTGENFEIRCIGSNSLISYYILNRVHLSFTDMYGRHLTLTETFYPAQDTVNKFESGYYSLNYRVGPASGYIFAVTIRAFQAQDAGLYTCSLIGCDGHTVDIASKLITVDDD